MKILDTPESAYFLLHIVGGTELLRQFENVVYFTYHVNKNKYFNIFLRY